MNGTGTQLRAYFEATTEPVSIEEILDGSLVVGRGAREDRRESMITQERKAETKSWWKGGPRLAAGLAAVLVVVVAGVAVIMSGSGSGGEAVLTAQQQAQIAQSAVDDVFEAFNAQDTAALTEFFGADVVINSDVSNTDWVGPDAVRYLEKYYGQQATRVSDAVAGPDGTWVMDSQWKATPDATRSTPVKVTVTLDGSKVVLIDLD